MSIVRHLQYWQIQCVTWLVILAAFWVMIFNRPIFVETELFYSLVLISSTGFAAHINRLIYKRFFRSKALIVQALALSIGSIGFSAFATLLLFASVIALSYTEFAFPIPAEQRFILFNQIFYANWFNMAVLLLLWSSVYFGVTKGRQLLQAKQVIKQTRLEVLQNQLYPHFLFNALNNIRALILEDKNKSREMLSSLSDMLRYSVSKDSQAKVELQEELIFIQNYIDLCQIQFESRLRYRVETHDNILRYLVPKMMIQLCVENAIKHGVEPNIEGGEIVLSVNLVKAANAEPEDCDFLKIVILNTFDQQGSKAPSLGLGIENIQKRLALLYDDKASFNLKQNQKSTQVTICLPLEIRELAKIDESIRAKFDENTDS